MKIILFAYHKNINSLDAKKNSNNNKKKQSKKDCGVIKGGFLMHNRKNKHFYVPDVALVSWHGHLAEIIVRLYSHLPPCYCLCPSASLIEFNWHFFGGMDVNNAEIIEG